MKDRFTPVNLEEFASPKGRGEKRVVSPEAKATGREEYEKRKNELMVAAILQHIQAISYRGLRVGSSVLVSNKHAEGGFQIESAHNYKPREHRQHSWDKLCAENNACTAAILDEGDYISAIVVASHHKEIGEQPEDKQHNEHALHSCRNCRNLFRELIKQRIMSDETIIRFVNDDSLIYLDDADLEELIGGTESAPLKVKLPKLKLKKEITEKDVAGLPYEELTMGKFLNMEGYKNDPPSPPSQTPPPYTLR